MLQVININLTTPVSIIEEDKHFLITVK